MRFQSLAVYALIFQLSISGFVHGQKNIEISDSLAANSKKLKVKLGIQWMGKTWKIHFGDYSIVQSKMGWTTRSYKENLFNNRTESKSTLKFSFSLCNKQKDSARVNAASNIMIQSLNDSELFPHIFWDNHAMVQDSHNFSAFISVGGNPDQSWALLMNIIWNSRGDGSYEAFLTDGERKIFLMPVSSNKQGNDPRKIPAQGYEFIENSQSLCALQFYGGGYLGMNRNIVWILDSLDPKMKLVLAAAVAAILQMSAAPRS